MRVLVVEDFEVLARSMGTGLRREGMAVDVVLDGTAALDRLAVTRYDVVILDRDMPGVHGDEICRRLAHGRCESRILMLTASGTIEDRVDGLSLGADDYLPKPFAFTELVARVRALARRATRLDLGEPTDELTELGHTLDDLFARLEASFDAQRHFVANASHELRTPLAGLRTLLEVALADPDADTDTLRSACQEALALGAHQERLVHALLTLATSERGVTCWDTLDLAHIVEGVLASRRDQATETGVDLAEHLAPAVTAGDPKLIESLVANLIDNAIRHNHPDGHVEITTQTSGTQVALTVTNTGPVIPGDQVQRLFQPFQKLASHRHGRRDGYGLGLAIVNAVTRAHHATLTTSARPEGGLSITVRFAHGSHPDLP